jgi:hypothetical protein
MKNVLKNFATSLLKHKFSALLGMCFLCIVGLFAYEVFPRFIVISFPPPHDDYDTFDWMFPTYSIQATEIVSRNFLWRGETILVYKNIPDGKSREMIVNYFDKQLSNDDWLKSEEYEASCSDFMPETKFLNPMKDFSENGYIEYLKKDYRIIGRGYVNDSVCIAIWNTSPGVFSVVILTTKPSPLTLFWDGINY